MPSIAASLAALLLVQKSVTAQGPPPGVWAHRTALSLFMQDGVPLEATALQLARLFIPSLLLKRFCMQRRQLLQLPTIAASAGSFSAVPAAIAAPSAG